MCKKDICPLCKGTGIEEHRFTRNDGEEVVEYIRCELCGGEEFIRKETEVRADSYACQYGIQSEKIFSSSESDFNEDY